MFTKKQVLRSLYWKNSGIVYRFGVDQLVKLALAYYLLPEHFGIISMVSASLASHEETDWHNLEPRHPLRTKLFGPVIYNIAARSGYTI